MDLSLIGANIAKLWTNYWHIYLIEGVLTTLKLTIFAVVLGALLGIVVAMLKMSKNKIVRFLITVYIEVIRGTPLLLQLYIFYFVLPELLPIFDFNEFTWVAISLCINSSAYVSEIFRSGFQSVDKGQTEAARSLGLSSGQT
ncbi:MAG: amino acid ABC transporter permease, partial [Oscillospiraceae bacterium]|nr:amino acid ABC transporter permease [Oscillospiraceae bacterium]